jgi:activating signal cointegrator 1
MIKPIMGLSLHQPWASLMSLGVKRCETRSWLTNYRGLVAIHAAKKWDQELRETCHSDPFAEALFGDDKFAKTEDLPRGCFVALGKLRHCLSTTEHFRLIPSDETHEYYFGNYDPGRFMWVFDEIWKLSAPVYTPGHQGLWRLDEGAADVVMAMLPDGIEDQILGGTND